ncbi:uncharacterized protein LOC144440931 [Glandiceps talaboti]
MTWDSLCGGDPQPQDIWTVYKMKPVSELKKTIIAKMGLYLSDKHLIANGWEILAETLGLEPDDIIRIRLEGGKDGKVVGEVMLECWAKKGQSSTVKVLEDHLIAIDRPDVLQILYQSAFPVCQLTCSVKDQDMTFDLPHQGLVESEEASLRVALEGPLQRFGYKIDNLEIQPISNRKVAWADKTSSVKGCHLVLYVKQPLKTMQDNKKEDTEPIGQTKKQEELGTNTDECKDSMDSDSEYVIQDVDNISNGDHDYENMDFHLGWHPFLPDIKEEIIRVMGSYIRADGYYILRKTKHGHHAISVTYLGKIKHFRVYKKKNNWYIWRSGPRKDSLPNLLMWYKQNPLPLHTDSASENTETDVSGEAPPLPPRVSLKLKYPVCVDLELQDYHKTVHFENNS